MADVQLDNPFVLLVDWNVFQAAATQIQTLILFFAQINVFHDYYIGMTHANMFMIKIAVAIV